MDVQVHEKPPYVRFALSGVFAIAGVATAILAFSYDRMEEPIQFKIDYEKLAKADIPTNFNDFLLADSTRFVRVLPEDLELSVDFDDDHSSEDGVSDSQGVTRPMEQKPEILTNPVETIKPPVGWTEPMPSGLVNPRFHCFLNSLLQCLAVIYPYIGPYSNEPSQPYYEIIKLLDEMVLKIRDGKPGESFPSDPLYQMFQKENRFSFLFDGRQQDSHEVLEMIFALMEDRQSFTESFSITLVSKCICTCGYESDEILRESLLTIPFFPMDEPKLESLIEGYFDFENLTDSPCGVCNETENRKRRFSIKSPLPTILGIHLIRFAFNPKTFISSKIDTAIKIPEQLEIEALDENLNTMECRTYRLMAVNMHSGSTSGGHYTALVRYPSGTEAADSWFYCSDTHISKSSLGIISEGNYGSATPYILFYVRYPE